MTPIDPQMLAASKAAEILRSAEILYNRVFDGIPGDALSLVKSIVELSLDAMPTIDEWIVANKRGAAPMSAHDLAESAWDKLDWIADLALGDPAPTSGATSLYAAIENAYKAEWIRWQELDDYNDSLRIEINELKAKLREFRLNEGAPVSKSLISASRPGPLQDWKAWIYPEAPANFYELNRDYDTLRSDLLEVNKPSIAVNSESELNAEYTNEVFESAKALQWFRDGLNAVGITTHDYNLESAIRMAEEYLKPFTPKDESTDSPVDKQSPSDAPITSG